MTALQTADLVKAIRETVSNIRQFSDVMNPGSTKISYVVAATALDALATNIEKALSARTEAPPSDEYRVAVAYQIIGCIADRCGLFDLPEIQNALDYLSDVPGGKDPLPFLPGPIDAALKRTEAPETGGRGGVGSADSIRAANHCDESSCGNPFGPNCQCFADLIAAARAEERDMLNDPNAVHVSMLAGKIARPSWAQIKHIYAAEHEADIAEERKVCAEIVQQSKSRSESILAILTRGC